MRLKNLISIQDLSKQQILELLSLASHLKKRAPEALLKGKILSSCFFEPSTRTRLSFESAMLRLGGNVIGFSGTEMISIAKGESLSDTMRIVGSYADVIILRHPSEGAAQLAQEATSTPIINAGDGGNQHPTQTLVDLFSIQECQDSLENLNLAIAGDLKYGRTAHSLAFAASLFNMRLYFVSPENLFLPESICESLKRKGVKFSFHRSLEEVLAKADILYLTRLQKERLSPHEKSAYDACSLKLSMLEEAKQHLKILHPLPRQEELEPAIDHSPHAYYFQQAENGLFVRQALLLHILDVQEKKSLVEMEATLVKTL